METLSMQLEWLLYFGVPVLVLLFYFARQVKANREKERNRIKRSFGQRANKKYYHEEYENISHGYIYTERTEDEIDDITWNDFNMDEVFRSMDNTQSSLGQEALYRILRQTKVEEKELLERDRLMDFFTKKEKERLDLSMVYSEYGFSRKFAVADYISFLGECPNKPVIMHIIQMVVFIAALAYCVLVDAVVGIGAVIVVAAINMITYFREKAEMENYYVSIKQMFAMCAAAKKICSLKISELAEYNEKLDKLQNEFASMQRFSFIMVSGKNGIIEFFLDYLRMFTHLDIVKFYRVVNLFGQNKDKVWELYNTLGYLDAMIACASYREYLPYWSRPKFNQGSGAKASLTAEEIYHPLIENPVENSIQTDKSVLLTGSNASGKSTFLRSVGINAVLSQTIFTSTAKSYKADKFRILSSMALKDNLMGNESYYMVEIKSLKRIMDASQRQGFPVLCFIDEVLRGTNTIERIASSSQILKELSDRNTLCFAATHDIELTAILENHYDNYHFAEQITQEDIRFDYKLRDGKATSRNAIRLLGLLGYDKNILDEAFGLAGYFEKNGCWRKI